MKTKHNYMTPICRMSQMINTLKNPAFLPGLRIIIFSFRGRNCECCDTFSLSRGWGGGNVECNKELLYNIIVNAFSSVSRICQYNSNDQNYFKS